MKRVGVIGLMFLAASFTGCAASSSDGSSASDPPRSEKSTAESGGKYDQSWPKNYGRTTCREWLNDMSQNENFVAAADMLVGAQQVDSEDAGLPEDDLIKKFQGGITNVCEVSPGDKITSISAALYLTERSTFKP